MDDVSATVVVAPLFLPLMEANGVDPVHFAAIVACSGVIGANSPPVASTLFLSCKNMRCADHESGWPRAWPDVFRGVPGDAGNDLLARSFSCDPKGARPAVSERLRSKGKKTGDAGIF